ncbi:MAG: 50S ribosomal protein L6 [Candidatus Cardinium sp.]|uniref:50S ribosomal protein L6 n=1 Tax=Candidatus Cardinium hertigii TaxID=247481 RepID=A0A2Z3L8L6_9BACT|nr:50S ribosomal protein L6 [Candidatus Cardinium hertigii]AWN81749.1 50S ribosomal protein L6 [Candidatus Cardinium hertigii]MDD9139605.1 50S ribosomal protein L6 [Candidatus Cardinium sp.]
MARIGKKPIPLPQDVEVVPKEGGMVQVSGKKGVLQQWIDPTIGVQVEAGMVRVFPVGEGGTKHCNALHGLYRALLHNMVIGVSMGFKHTLELVGVGYRANLQGNLLELSLGYSHDIVFELPEEIAATTEVAKGKNPLIHLESIDKQLLGQVSAKIRSLRKVEPYKGKGIRFLGERVRRKAGKSTKK